MKQGARSGEAEEEGGRATAGAETDTGLDAALTGGDTSGDGGGELMAVTFVSVVGVDWAVTAGTAVAFVLTDGMAFVLLSAAAMPTALCCSCRSTLGVLPPMPVMEFCKPALEIVAGCLFL